MPTRNVVLTDHHEGLIADLVESGRYQNASEVLREGLRLVEQREAENAAKLKTLRDAAQLGFDSLDQGRYREIQITELEDYIAGLGLRASERVRGTDR